MTIDAHPFPVAVTRVRRARRPLVWAITALLLVIGLVLADWWQANREMHDLIHAVAVSQVATRTGAGGVNDYINRYFDGTYMSQSARDSANNEVRTKCFTAAADVQDTGAQMSEVFVLPWHLSLGKAQNAYLAYNKAWLKRFSGCADDAKRWADLSTSAQINATLRVAYRAFVTAVPVANSGDRNVVDYLLKG